jgi:hypothetical protein
MNRLERRRATGWTPGCDHIVDVSIIRRHVPELEGEYYGLVEDMWVEWSKSIGVEWLTPYEDEIEAFGAWLRESV